MNIRLFLLFLLFPTMLFLHQEFYHSDSFITQTTMTTLETKRILEDIQNTLPQWRTHFEKYGQKYNVPWTLIAAVSYQESKWNNEAISFTGVKGLMQLTEVTADHIGITDREDPVQSIQGGALYLKYLYEKSPKYLSPSERWVQALAGYNIGWAHLRDLHRLAKFKHMNAYHWKELKTLLPMKADENYREHFNFGLARGKETVDFIENVIIYYQFLNIQFPEKTFQNRIANIDSQILLSQIQFLTN